MTAEGQATAVPRGWLARLGLDRPELRAWAMYDWANSAFVTTVVAAVFPPYFHAVAASGLPPGAAFTRFGVATTLAILAIGIASPVLGAIADFTATRKRFLLVFLLLGVASVAGMFHVSHGQWLLGLVLLGLANIGAAGSFVFYDALLPHIARDDEMHRVSTAGYALGYLGGGLLLALNLAWIANPGLFGLPAGEDLTPAAATLPVRLAFLSVAVWWLVFSIPLLRRVPEPPRVLEADEAGTENAVRIAFVRLAETFRSLRGFRHAFLMLLAFLIYGDGISTIIRMATLYGSELGIERNAMILAILITQFVGVPCAFVFGALAGRIGAKTAISAGLVAYIGIAVLGYHMTTAAHFLLLATLVGMVQGGTQALSRSLFATLIPSYKSGEFFGFYGVMDRFSGSLGTLAMTITAALTGSSRAAILAVIGFFVIGLVLLRFVDVERGRLAAREAERLALTTGRPTPRPA